MSRTERTKLREKGIFTVNQLSYTFRPRHRPKSHEEANPKYYHALKALAIREKKIHVAGQPKFDLPANPAYLDVEGVPDRDFYYLVGLRTKDDGIPRQESFWADCESDEHRIWESLCESIRGLSDPGLIHYGRYEARFIRKMLTRYPEVMENDTHLRQTLMNADNLLSRIYAHAYFPTYGNGLKEIAGYLGFHWSDPTASGIYSLLWRERYESGEGEYKERLMRYNAEDCSALEVVAETLSALAIHMEESYATLGTDIVHTDALTPPHAGRFSRKRFASQQFKVIADAAYWNYQRNHVYVRSSKRIRHIVRCDNRKRVKSLAPNKVIVLPPPECCPQCGGSVGRISRNMHSRIVKDIRFGRGTARRWVVEYRYQKYSCHQCRLCAASAQYAFGTSKYGMNLKAYVVYQAVELKTPLRSVAENTKVLFRIDISDRVIGRFLEELAFYYQNTYDTLLRKMLKRGMIHADETRIAVKKKNAYVWVFASMEEVVYIFSPTREGDVVKAALGEFRGVLISDFYAAYDSVDCPQQKCLIHLTRDLNDDVVKYPFDIELNDIGRDFVHLLNDIIETIDRFGLRKYFLKKHKKPVRGFFRNLAKRIFSSSVAVKWQKRLLKSQEKLFTFLDYDNVPWNNNNAEHAIKSFATLRRNIKGLTTEDGIKKYLVLLSILVTCKYKGASFLDFLLSGEQNIDEFIGHRLR